MDTVSVASRFVDLALAYRRWDKIESLPDDEVQVLLETAVAAGFEATCVVPGKLRGDWLDQGGRTGETYPVNSLCPFKVVSGGGDHYFATGWLDCALRRVVTGSRRGESREQLIEAISLEIERSVPLQPIQLTPEGDLLREYPPSERAFGSEYFVDHTRDDHELRLCVGVHVDCNGWMDRCRADAAHDAIVCRHCHLQVHFPREVKTYGELRHTLP